ALRAIASEGRKFGLGLMVISQRPARVDKNVISQCNTQIIMKITNPNDLNAIKKGIEGITSEMIEEVKRLPPGYAVVVSSGIDMPIVVRIRVRKSAHSEAVKVVESEVEEVPRKSQDSGEKKRGFFSKILRRG
ncbi:MAG: ATP-binding protein, partial [Archaeoglobaceae archaeon]